MKTIDQRIEEDLAQLFRDGVISGAKEIIDSNLLEVSSKGLPGYFCGDRDAPTVFVNLNPGADVAKCDDPDKQKKDDEKYGIDRRNLESLIRTYYEKGRTYGEKYDKLDYFDLKQAAFLSSWKDNGMDLPKEFYRDKNVYKEAQKRSLLHHLQLELLPYASRKFTPNRKNIHILIPYVETLFEEIFRVERKYVIFGSRYFCDLFKLIGDKDDSDFGVEFVARKEPKDFSIESQVHFSCNVVKMRYKNKTRYALVANTFPNQALSKALEKMFLYGNECFEFYQSKA